MTKDTDQENGLGKVCTKCGEWKSLEKFGLRKNRKGERVPFSRCKSCENASSAKKRSRPGYAEKERLANRLYAAERRANDPNYVASKNEKNRIYAARRREDPDHRESINLLRRVLWATDEQYRIRSGARLVSWINENYDRWRCIGANRRSLERGADGKFTPDDIDRINKSQEFKCVYCGASTEEEFHIDHIHPISRGGTNWPDNLQILCRSCNCSKKDKTHEEFLTYRLVTVEAIAESLTNL